jgi:hypothetical protein
MRAWKLGTAISTALVGWFTLVEVDYTSSEHIQAYQRRYGDEDPHVLASLQRYVRSARNRLIFGVDVPSTTKGDTNITNSGLSNQDIDPSGRQIR